MADHQGRISEPSRLFLLVAPHGWTAAYPSIAGVGWMPVTVDLGSDANTSAYVGRRRLVALIVPVSEPSRRHARVAERSPVSAAPVFEGHSPLCEAQPQENRGRICRTTLVVAIHRKELADGHWCSRLAASGAHSARHAYRHTTRQFFFEMGGTGSAGHRTWGPSRPDFQPWGRGRRPCALGNAGWPRASA
jgi:hypothetical protein